MFFIFLAYFTSTPLLIYPRPGEAQGVSGKV